MQDSEITLNSLCDNLNHILNNIDNVSTMANLSSIRENQDYMNTLANFDEKIKNFMQKF